MTIDWNWFFAAFAQCGAALIAIIGAFIISKLIGEAEKEEKYASDKEALDLEYQTIKNSIKNRYFDWYDKHTIEGSKMLKEKIMAGEFDYLEIKEKKDKLFKILPKAYGTPGGIAALDILIEKYNNRTNTIDDFFSTMQHANLSNKLSEEKELIESLHIESVSLIGKFKIQAKNINAAIQSLKPIEVTIYALIFGLLATVIYPLHFMPLEINEVPNIGFSRDLIISHIFSLKGFLLILLTIVIEGIFVYFLLLVIRTRRKYHRLMGTFKSDYTTLSSYSEYFRDTK